MSISQWRKKYVTICPQYRNWWIALNVIGIWYFNQFVLIAAKKESSPPWPPCNMFFFVRLTGLYGAVNFLAWQVFDTPSNTYLSQPNPTRRHRRPQKLQSHLLRTTVPPPTWFCWSITYRFTWSLSSHLRVGLALQPIWMLPNLLSRHCRRSLEVLYIVVAGCWWVPPRFKRNVSTYYNFVTYSLWNHGKKCPIGRLVEMLTSESSDTINNVKTKIVQEK